ncbi:hypothetical protein [Robbsia andropogonis]|nr:hypothetical protein [Robbsia andropogonis]MCP1119076.1 hypothetical protein [Robbsia andropogonis]MCP1129073.1 hypothetical protein [Robbsia andropogonis]
MNQRGSGRLSGLTANWANDQEMCLPIGADCRSEHFDGQFESDDAFNNDV